MTATLLATDAPNYITTENYCFLQDHLYRNSGIVLESGKNYLLEARLLPIVAKQRLHTLNELCTFLKGNSNHPLHREVVDALTTNETLFFRDAPFWQALRTEVIPELVQAHRQSKRLRFWSAASSSGQEAYSLSMLLLEMGLGDWDFQVLGTDISVRMVERARTGAYSQIEVNRGLPATHLVKYFVRQGLDWIVKDEIRKRVSFEQLDLRQKQRRFGPFDLVLCRNVLIYFDKATKEDTLREIREAIGHAGFLALGTAETTLSLDNFYQRRSIGLATFYQAK